MAGALGLLLLRCFSLGWRDYPFYGIQFHQRLPDFRCAVHRTDADAALASLHRLRHLTTQEAWVAFGIVALFVSLVLDMLSAHGFIEWIGKAGQWGLVLFTLSLLVVYLLKDRRQQQALTILRNNLDAQVADRTRELEASRARMEQLAERIFLPDYWNRRAFMELADREVANSKRHHRPCL